MNQTPNGPMMTPEEYWACDDAVNAGIAAAQASFRAHGICWNSSADRPHPLGPDGRCTVPGCRMPASGLEPARPPHDEAPCVGCGELTRDRAITGLEFPKRSDLRDRHEVTPWCATCERKRRRRQWERIAANEAVFPLLREEARRMLSEAA